jgi:hypothetical protein
MKKSLAKRTFKLNNPEKIVNVALKMFPNIKIIL